MAEGKFYSLFSFLFGLGFTLQLASAERRGQRFLPRYFRRLLVLLLGILHATFIWPGDILTLYATLCALLLTAAALLSLSLLLNVVFFDPIQSALGWEPNDYRDDAARAAQVYTTGDFAAITAQRVSDQQFWGYTGTFFAPNVLAMFLLGAYVGNLPLARFETTPTLSIALLAQAIGVPALCGGYIAAITLLVRREDWRARLAPLASAGHMALSNYLGQSLICTLIFYNYGLGLFDQVGAAAGFLLTIVIFAAQVLVSGWWLHHFRTGPVEWAWRSLTNLAPQPFRRPVFTPSPERVPR